ncbi:MAG TPA: AbrB/MazE/SpoVT family DNA-binding domain-containing protein [Silvibacterium sp.]|nr:AbrB/MazE/SpoVT family DNA-binding domain-containing protein [Silvibacterium sp.]
MGMTAKITSKGQITVPHQVRRALGVREGDRLKFEERSGGEMTVIPVREESPFARYRGIGNPGVGSGKRAVVKKVRALRGE